ncbi:hypothetical protein V5799_011349 [Amblyomma americanum]|uniref:Uncharacterized protein n=1 Tax=Amblyomma americanum TaxID=6943 RepID=A0AAQ4EHI1_AMBAM
MQTCQLTWRLASARDTGLDEPNERRALATQKTAELAVETTPDPIAGDPERGPDSWPQNPQLPFFFSPLSKSSVACASFRNKFTERGRHETAF